MSNAEADFMAGLLLGLDASFSSSAASASSPAKSRFPSAIQLAPSPHDPTANTRFDAPSNIPIIDLTERHAPSSSPPKTPNRRNHENLPETSVAPNGGVVQGDPRDVDLEELLAGAEHWDLDDYVPSPKKPSPQKPSSLPAVDSKVSDAEPYTRCVVTAVSEVELAGRWSKQLDVHVDKDSRDIRTICLQDDWYDTDVRPGDIVNAIGTFSASGAEPPSIKITSQTNLLILHPDILITATALSNAPQCGRKPLLSSLVRASSDVTPALVWGNMLHEVMQSCLIEHRWEEAWINERIDEVLLNGLGMLLALNVSVETARTELRRKAIGLGTFKDRYISDMPKPDAVLSDTRARASDSDALLAIPQLHEIEEDIWSPKYGLKGKVDATVEAVIAEMPPIVSKNDVMNKYLSRPAPSSSYNPKSGTLPSTSPLSNATLTAGPRPFEIKTGRSIAALEHRAQTMLYTLLASERYGTDVPDGLLYYTQSDTVVRVPRTRNELRGLMVARNGLAGYMIKRIGRENELGHKRRREIAEREEDIEAIGMGAEPFLPAPIDNEHTCKKCYTVDTCMLYRYAYSVTPPGSKLPALESPPTFSSTPSSLYDAYELKTGHLTPEQGLFFRKWETLLSLEERDLVRFRRELWTIGADDREKKGRCFAGMVLKPNSAGQKTGGLDEDQYAKDAMNLAGSTPGEGKEYKFSYTFVRSSGQAAYTVEGEQRSLLNGHMNVGDPVTLSVEPHLLAFAQGYITQLTPNEVRLGVDHRVDLEWIRARLRKDRARTRGEDEEDEVVFRIDKDELFGGMGRMRNNLAQLFYVKGDKKRLELVVDLRKPLFNEPERSLSTLDSPHVAHLNKSQQEAITKALSVEDYALILGMPGTGKTTVIAALIKILVDQGKTVLLTSYTHSAVDTILRKLEEQSAGSDEEGEGQSGRLGFGVLRLGNVEKIHPDVRKYTIGALKKAVTVEQVEAQWMRPPVVAATCLSVDHPLFNRRQFDYCIIDEASQITLPTCLGPLRFADKFILVGDHFQLPPLVKNPLARRGGLDVSLFRRLSDAHPESVIDLREQYRMNEDIMALSNKLIYNDRLKCGSDEVAKKRLVLPNASDAEIKRLTKKADGGSWLSHLASPDTTAVFVDTDTLGHGVAHDSRVGDLVQNEMEAELVVRFVEELVGRWGVKKKDVGVISLYRQQVKLIKSLLGDQQNGSKREEGAEEEDLEQVEVLTADKSQGRDKECIVVSMVRSNDNGQVGDLVKDWRRMNVSFTRARSKLVIFGSRKTLKADALLSQFFDLMEGRGWVYELPPGAHLGVSQEVEVEADEKKEDKDGPREDGSSVLEQTEAEVVDVKIEVEVEDLTMSGDEEDEMDATLVATTPVDWTEVHGTLVDTTSVESSDEGGDDEDEDVEIVDGPFVKPQPTSKPSTSKSTKGDGKRKNKDEPMVIDIEDDESMAVDTRPVGELKQRKSGGDGKKAEAASSKSKSTSSKTVSKSSSNGSLKRSHPGKENIKGMGPLDKYFFSTKASGNGGSASGGVVSEEKSERPTKKMKVEPPVSEKKGKRVASGAKAKAWPKETTKEDKRVSMDKKASGLLKGRPILHELVSSDC